MKKRIAVLLSLMLVLSLCVNVNAVYGAKNLNDIKSDIKEKNKQLQEGKSQERELSQEIQALETKIGAAENAISSLDKKIEDTENKIEKAKAQLKKAQQEVQIQNDNLNVRLRTMYKNGSIGFLDVLLGSGSISEFISNMDMVKKIHANDREVLGTLEDEYAKIEKKKKELDNLETELQTAKSEQAAKQEELSASKKVVAKKKANVVASNEALEDNIAELNQEADRIASIINNDSSGNKGNGGSGGPSYSGGQFAWPVPGWSRISSNYGWRICPFHGREKHTGIDIPASYGTPVVAAAGGTVIFAGYLGSYGNAVIISHGGGLYTLYGHNSSLVKWSGSKVSRGQTIAKIGSTGSSTGNHCHFEVRKGGSGYGNDVNPWNYL